MSYSVGALLKFNVALKLSRNCPCMTLLRDYRNYDEIHPSDPRIIWAHYFTTRTIQNDGTKTVHVYDNILQLGRFLMYAYDERQLYTKNNYEWLIRRTNTLSRHRIKNIHSVQQT